jgi:YD repeat-containing protein
VTEHLTDTTARYRRTAGPTTLTHDANGNLAQECSGSSCTAYVYDPENRLVAVTGARPAQLRYDPHGRLLLK